MKTSSRIVRNRAKTKAVKEALRTAKITLTVSKFVDVLTSEAPQNERNTKCVPKVAAHHPQVTLTPAEPGKPPAIRVHGGGATLHFEIRSRDPKCEYYPIGIAFRRRKNRGPDNDQDDILGRQNFSFASMHLWGRSLYITDHFKDCGTGDRYKFSVILQRQHDGAIGIIDPDIDHDRLH